MANNLYGKLEYALYGVVLVVSAGVAVVAERLDFHLQKQVLAAEIANFNQDFAHRLEAEIAQLAASALGLSAAVALNGDIDERQFARAALRLGTDKDIVRSISLATNGIVRHIYPSVQSSAMIGSDLRTLPDHIEGIELARKTGRPVLVGPMDLIDGGRGLILRVAFASNFDDRDPSTRREMISIVVDSTAFFEKQIPDPTKTKILTAVTAGEDDVVVWGNPEALQLHPLIELLETPSNIWQISSAPIEGWPVYSSRALTISGLALLRTLLVSAVLKGMFGLLRRQKAAERQLTDAIEALDDGFAVVELNVVNIQTQLGRRSSGSAVD